MKCYKWFPIVAAVSLGIFFLINGSCFAEKGPYTSFAKGATSALPESYYDYIIIGGGTAGCALAATLSASTKVLVLERGGLPYDNPDVSNQNGTLRILADMSPSSASQMFISTDGVFNHRGRILGGSSAINGGFYSRASHEQVKDVGWDPRLVNESYVWVENKVVFKPLVSGWQEAMRGGLVEAGVLPYRGFTYEHLEGTKIGGSTFDEDGHRHTAADLLEYANPTNINVFLHAVVHQILFTTSPGQRPKAYGVFFKDSSGIGHTAYLNSGPNNEIIVSAGALGSPQLLMLSGIGPAKHLMGHEIKVVLDRPLVGKGMSDNPMNAILTPSPRPVQISGPKVVGISDVGNIIETGGVYFELQMVEAFAKSINQSIIRPLITILEAMRRLYPYPFPNTYMTMIVEKVTGPFSTGYLELESKDPNDNPRVTFNYFQDPRDLKRCVQGMKIIKSIFVTKSVSTFHYPFTSFESMMKLMLALPVNLRKKHLTSIFSMEQFCIDTVMTMWHYHGGCQVGRVVDHDYRVIGVDSLRVIDGSTFNSSPGTNPQATVMMLGRYMGQKILGERVSQ